MANKKPDKEIVSVKMTNVVYTIRNQRVMLDRDLAIIFKTETRKINQQVKRNQGRFGNGYSFKLNDEEFKNLRKILRSQNVISNWGGVRYPPTAFTEKGIYMLATVLRSDVADQIAKHIVDTFTETKKILNENKELKKRILKLEQDASKKNEIIRTLHLIAQELHKKS
ncbi:MAG: ORF6N domain-containing protein [Candidatus Hodarchaeales archaeon]